MGDVILGSVDWVCFDGLFGAGEGPQSRDFLHLCSESTDCGSPHLGLIEIDRLWLLAFGGGTPFLLRGGGGPDAPTPVVTSLPGVAGP